MKSTRQHMEGGGALKNARHILGVGYLSRVLVLNFPVYLVYLKVR
jgi:hypothetical protein